jgi:DNA-directed RNA polymerase subunit RPC12/RpoP
MNPTIPNDAFGHVFAWAPLVIGIVIYAIVWFAKRNETGSAPAPIGQTYACASCGKRASKEHMVPQAHSGAVSYYCARCAGGH